MKGALVWSESVPVQIRINACRINMAENCCGYFPIVSCDDLIRTLAQTPTVVVSGHFKGSFPITQVLVQGDMVVK